MSHASRISRVTSDAFNREINTIGSKSANSSITRKVVDVKCELEKIREQIQNIE